MSDTLREAVQFRAGRIRLPARALLATAVFLGFVAGYLGTPDGDVARAVARAGPELTLLLRLMAGLKLLLAAGATLLIDWRLRFPVSAGRGGGYLLGVTAMAAGPALIWSMAHVALGAGLVHGGLAVLLLLFWRDPGASEMLSANALRRRPVRNR